MRYLKIGLLALFFLTLAFLFLALPRIITIKKITCSNQYGRCDEVLVSNLETVLGKSLAEAKTTLKSILAKDLLIKDFSLQYKIPETLQIYILIKKPKFALWNQEEKKAVLVDEAGTILTGVEETNLPKVIVSGKLLARGEKVNQKELFALELIAGLNYFYQVNEGILFEQRLEVILPGGIRVIFPLTGDRQVLLASLMAVFSGKIDKIREIDLRFKNPVLK